MRSTRVHEVRGSGAAISLDAAGNAFLAVPDMVHEMFDLSDLCPLIAGRAGRAFAYRFPSGLEMCNAMCIADLARLALTLARQHAEVVDVR